MIRSLRFLGVRTAAFDPTVALYRDVLGLTPVHEAPGAAWFRAADGGVAWNHFTAPDGNVYEIIGPDRGGA